MKYSELLQQMRDFNKKHGIERKVCEKQNQDGKLIEMIGQVVIKNECLCREFPIEQRTYQFSNYNKALTSSDLGYSIFASCQADGDVMRIERFNSDDIESAEIVSIVE